MRRLLQFATIVLLAAGFIAPIMEMFDQWDQAGLSNDTEFGLFALILVLTFLLCICELISSAALRFAFASSTIQSMNPMDLSESAPDNDLKWVFAISPSHCPPPLRI